MRKNNLIKFVKQNYEFILSILLLCLIFTISFKPTSFVKSSYQGLKIWANVVLPSLFVFFVLTKLLTQFESSRQLFGILDKPFNKMYNTKTNSGYIFLISIISGYPIGAKLVEEFYNNNLMTLSDAKKTISFCSTSGPMFILGSIAIQMFGDYKLGLVVFFSHMLSALLNGLLYRKIGTKNGNIVAKNGSYNEKIILNSIMLQGKNNPKILDKRKSLNDIMYDSIISILMIGGYITICFTMLEFLFSLSGYKLISSIASKIFGNNMLDVIVKGIVELTNGCVALSNITCNIKTTCVVLSSLISFGGLSIHLQSQIFLSKIGIKYRYFLLTKLTQTIITIFVSAIFSTILL